MSPALAAHTSWVTRAGTHRHAARCRDRLADTRGGPASFPLPLLLPSDSHPWTETVGLRGWCPFCSTWELARNATSGPPPRPTESDAAGGPSPDGVWEPATSRQGRLEGTGPHLLLSLAFWKPRGGHILSIPSPLTVAAPGLLLPMGASLSAGGTGLGLSRVLLPSPGAPPAPPSAPQHPRPVRAAAAPEVCWGDRTSRTGLTGGL